MSAASKPPMDPAKKATKLHIDRIKREEDEDQWISGEELNTEGSSDEDEKGSSGRQRGGRGGRRDHKGARPKAQRSKAALQHEPPPPPLPPSRQDDKGRDSDSADEPIDISWKPKRGSIRLPHLVTEEETTVKRKSAEALKE